MPDAAAAVAIALTRFGVARKVIQRFALDRPLMRTLNFNRAKVAPCCSGSFGVKGRPDGQAAASTITFTWCVLVKNINGAACSTSQHAIAHHGLCMSAADGGQQDGSNNCVFFMMRFSLS